MIQRDFLKRQKDFQILDPEFGCLRTISAKNSLEKLITKYNTEPEN